MRKRARPPRRRDRTRDLGTAGTTRDLALAFALGPTAVREQERIADEGALLRARVDSPRVVASPPARHPRRDRDRAPPRSSLEAPAGKKKALRSTDWRSETNLEIFRFQPPRSILTRLPPNPQDGYLAAMWWLPATCPRDVARRPGRRAGVHGGPRRRGGRDCDLKAMVETAEARFSNAFRTAADASAEVAIDVRTVPGDDVAERKRGDGVASVRRGGGSSSAGATGRRRTKRPRRIRSAAGSGSGPRTTPTSPTSPTPTTTARTTSAPRTTRWTPRRSRVCTRTSASARSARNGGSLRGSRG